MEFCALASGSSGNSFFVGSKVNGDRQGILIDAGISTKKIIERMQNIGRKAEDIKAIFITHEHIDHIRGADFFSRKFDVPIYSTKKTSVSSFLCSQKENIHYIKNDEIIKVGGMEVEAFMKEHKASDPVSFSLTEVNNGKAKKLGVITDVGIACNNVRDFVSNSDSLFIEANHDVRMLENGRYPYFLKQWIGGSEGHLSNYDAALAVLEHAPSKVKHVILSHLSLHNNTPQVALKTFSDLLKERRDLKPKLTVSTRDEATKLFKI